jgi:hypothetical protein
MSSDYCDKTCFGSSSILTFYDCFGSDIVNTFKVRLLPHEEQLAYAEPCGTAVRRSENGMNQFLPTRAFHNE